MKLDTAAFAPEYAGILVRGEGVHAGDVEDYGVAFFCHVFGEYLGREEGAEEVEVEDEFYAGGVKIEEGFDALCCAFEVFGVEGVFGGGTLGVVSAGAVQEDVDCAEFLKDGFARGFEACLVENVCADGYGCAAVLGDFIDYFLRGVDSEVADGDFRAARGEGFREFGAEDSAAAGDEGDFSGQIYFER